jgi:antirestriction protein ArdC
MPICASRKGLSRVSPLPRPSPDDTDQTIHCSPSSKLSDYAEQPRRNAHYSGDLNVRRGIIRVSALWTLCRYRHKSHSTGHKKRLDRDFGGHRFGSEAYAIEELVAELGAAFICADLEIALEAREDHAAYIASWLKVLSHDTRAVFTAASHAQRAADFIHAAAAPAQT